MDVGADELRELIGHALAELDADERRGSILRATHGLEALDAASGSDGAGK